MTRRPVLVVDDDRDVLAVLREMLEDFGYEVIIAHDGREALECIARMNEAPLVLLDLLMPVVSGWEVMQALRQKDANIPIVVLSAAAETHEVLEKGAVAFLQKPVDLSALIEVLERFAGPRRGG